MSWYDPTSWNLGDVGKGFVLGGPIGGIVNGASGGSVWNSTLGNDPGADAEAQRKALLQQQAQQAGLFAQQGQTNYTQNTAGGQATLAALQAQAQGRESVSAEQLRQSMGQMLAQQRSLAAGASPRNAAMAALGAQVNAGRIGAGMAGQQALAGLQERNQAQQQYGQLLGQLRGQDLQAALGSRQSAIQGYGANNAGTPEKSWLEKYGPAIQSGASAIASDRALKTDIKPGDAAANSMIAKLQAYTYGYKDPATYGSGPQVGVMAQDLERAGLKQAVANTPAGKMVDTPKLAGANTAMIAALGRRVANLEGATGGLDPAADAEQRKLDERRAQLNPDYPRQKRVYNQVLVEQSDPQAAAAQYALNLRRAQIAAMAAGASMPVMQRGFAAALGAR